VRPRMMSAMPSSDNSREVHRPNVRVRKNVRIRAETPRPRSAVSPVGGSRGGESDFPPASVMAGL
jgi:hypothetical protein